MLVLIVLLLAAPASSTDDICVGLANDTQCATMHGYNMEPRPAVNRSNSVTFDLKEEYYNDQTKEVEETKWEEKKVVLYENEMKEINLTSDSVNINPRRMYVWYNQTGYLYAAVESIRFLASNTTNITRTTCSCRLVEMNQYLNTDDSQQVVYAKNWTKTSDGKKYYSDIVTITRPAQDVPLSNSPDPECFDWQVGQGYLPGADDVSDKVITAKTVTVNLTKMVYSERGSSDNATHHNIDTRIVTLTEGKREYVQLNYTNHTSDGFQYINPRNITLLFRGKIVYAGMAILFDQVSEGDNNKTSRRSVIACEERYDMDSNDPYDYVYIPISRSWSDTKRLDYYVFESYVHPDMNVWRDGEYLLLSVSSAGTWSLQLTIVLGVLSLFLGN